MKMVDVKTVTLDGKAWFKTQELADRWDCSVRKVRLMIERGDIACQQNGKMFRVPAAAILAYEHSCLVPTNRALSSGEESPRGKSTGDARALARARESMRENWAGPRRKQPSRSSRPASTGRIQESLSA